jgi:ubiquinol-cytochrome c reductase cytochrome c1 subunit
MKKLLTAVLLSASVVTGAFAAGGPSVPMADANIDADNKASLQRGARLYANYCLGCHGLKFQRYNRMGDDLGMDDELVKEHLMFTTNKVAETMDIAMPEREAATWFGQTPPDLSLITREKGIDYLYTYLTTFYVDESKETGVNNYAFPNASMPWVMWKLEGWKKPIYKEVDDHGKTVTKIVGYEQITEGEMSPEEFKSAMLDLTNFLHYVGEPIKQERVAIGLKVIAYLLLLFILSIFLKREFWKDVH